MRAGTWIDQIEQRVFPFGSDLSSPQQTVQSQHFCRQASTQTVNLLKLWQHLTSNPEGAFHPLLNENHGPRGAGCKSCCFTLGCKTLQWDWRNIYEESWWQTEDTWNLGSIFNEIYKVTAGASSGWYLQEKTIDTLLQLLLYNKI